MSCLYRKLDSAIMVMKPAADGRKYDAARVLPPLRRTIFPRYPAEPRQELRGSLRRWGRYRCALMKK
jgi:hypothetical protein